MKIDSPQKRSYQQKIRRRNLVLALLLLLLIATVIFFFCGGDGNEKKSKKSFCRGICYGRGSDRCCTGNFDHNHGYDAAD